MTATAQIARFKAAILALVVTAVALINPLGIRAAAGSPQSCVPGSTCTVGEFLFDDEYVPITSGTCTITSRYPDGSLFLNSQAMTGSADGWYAHEFTTPATEGLYRSQVCCTVGSDYLCVDKSFEALDSTSGSSLTTDDIASAVWGYGSRSLTGFGNLVSDVWGHSSRNLTSFGSLIQDMWKHDPRTVTSSGGDLAEIEKTVNENRLLLERLVNKPIIQNFVEEDVPDLSEVLSEARETSQEMFLNTQVVVSKLGVIMLSWEEMTGEEIGVELAELTAKTGKSTDTAGTGSIIGQATWLSDKWSWNEAKEVKDKASALSSALTRVDRALKGVGGWKLAYEEAKQALKLAESLESAVGTNLDEPAAKTIFGKIAQTSALASTWTDQQDQVDQLLREVKDGRALAIQGKIDEISLGVLATNLVPNGKQVIKPARSSEVVEQRIKNSLLAIRGLIDMNRVFVVKGAEGALAFTWLEEGSMVFKSVVTNPSTIIGQEVELKYYLPPEVREEDILETDEGLEVKYDSEKDQYYVEGKFLLKASESKTLAVRVDDLWTITDEEIASLKGQAAELAKPLERTAFFAQSVTIKSDIDVALDKIAVLIKTAVTPEQKIRSWREAQIEMGGVMVKMEKLKDLVTQSSATGGLQGFVGGAQVIAVWGLIIILLAGFVFLAIYMRMISGGKIKKTRPKETEVREEKPRPHTHSSSGWKIGFTVMVTAVISSAASSAVVARMMLARDARALEVAVVSEEGEVAGMTTTSGQTSEAVGGPELVKIVLDEGRVVNVKQEPAEDARTAFRARGGAEMEKLSQDGEWVEIGDGTGSTGWISDKYIGSVSELD